jgi:multidrug efflux pump subunit AcrA (membrane-fusion protein)
MLPDLRDISLFWLIPMRKSGFIIYYLVIGLSLSGFISLFFIHVEISVRAPGIIRSSHERTEIKSAVTGMIDSLWHHEGDHVESNDLIGECFVGTKDIGLLKPGQAVRFQVDAFNYNYFGWVMGYICSIDDDYTLIDKNPVFKVRCRMNQQKMQMRGGYMGRLKKGMQLQARFITGRRSLWQLLYDSVGNWLYPV